MTFLPDHALDRGELAAEHRVPLTTVTNYLAWTRRERRRLVRDHALDRLRRVTEEPELAAGHGIPLTTSTNHLAWTRRERRRFLRDRLERS